MPSFRNPYFVPPGPPPLTVDIGKAAEAVRTFLQAQAARPVVPESQLRALDPALVDDGVWARIKIKLRLVEA